MPENTVKNLNDFLTYINTNGLKNLLIGNGLILSHPELGDKLNWHMIYKGLGYRLLKNQDPAKCRSPEEYVWSCRKKLIYDILEEYIHALSKAISGPASNDLTIADMSLRYKDSKYCIKRFLQPFSDIYTTNYDPLLYFELFNNFGSNSFCDGFRGTTKLNSSRIVNNLKSCDQSVKKRLMYLHGSWIIQETKKEELFKISFKNFADLEKLLESKDKADAPIPYVVMEDRSTVKNHLIQGCKYLTYCYEELMAADDILIFGLSFLNDDHLLEAFKNKKNAHFAVCNGDNELPKKLKQFEGLNIINVPQTLLWEMKQ